MAGTLNLPKYTAVKGKATVFVFLEKSSMGMQHIVVKWQIYVKTREHYITY